MKEIALWFLIFISYSVAGWAMEVLVSILHRKKFINRGFLVGPICPIYGTGALLLAAAVQSQENILAIFCISVVGSTILEYTISVIMEKLFRVRWWDYSKKPFNINGRICLETTISFGIIGVLATKFFTPALINLYSNLPETILITLAIVFAVLLIIDLIISLWLMLGVRVAVGVAQLDATDEISTRVHEILSDKNRLHKHLIKAFPNQQPSQKPVKARASKMRNTSTTPKPTKLS